MRASWLAAVIMVWAVACGPRSDDECVVALDWCETGCEQLCVPQREADRINGSCDLGCPLDTGELRTSDDCVAAGRQCVWAE